MIGVLGVKNNYSKITLVRKLHKLLKDLPIIEAFVATHGGIDIQTTMEKAVKTAQFVIAQSLQYEEDDL